MNTYPLEIDLNEEYKIKIEEPNELGKSYFNEIYEKAGRAASEILKKSEISKKLKPNDPFIKQEQEYNNIIAFCGERGTGKSSAMITFAKSLVNIEDANYESNKKKPFYDEDLYKIQFESLSVIDPTIFEEKENIFEVVLAQLFSSFEKELNKNNKHEIEDKRKVLELFQKVYDNLKTVQKNGEKYNGEALETLSKLSCGANLRSTFSELVSSYLSFIKKDCLIIPVDDFDLNVNAVSDMAEQLRKYLMIPNVIILMAADMKQLSDAIEQSIRKDFNILIKSKAMSESPKSITS
jgi:DNA polymerase III delta prime subunit